MSKLKKCPICGKEPQLFSRWCNDELLYAWYQCDSTPPCYVGLCYSKDQRDELISGWNEQIKSED